MPIEEFEAMLARAGYHFLYAYPDHAATNRVYVWPAGGPIINVEVNGAAIDPFRALKCEAMLDEEGYFKEEDNEEEHGAAG